MVVVGRPATSWSVDRLPGGSLRGRRLRYGRGAHIEPGSEPVRGDRISAHQHTPIARVDEIVRWCYKRLPRCDAGLFATEPFTADSASKGRLRP